MKQTIKYFSCGVISLLSAHVFAADVLKITVKTSERTAAAIGYTVEGKASGGIGKSYSSTGTRINSIPLATEKTPSLAPIFPVVRLPYPKTVLLC